MSEATRRFLKLPDGTMHESAHGDWVRYDDLVIAIQRAEAARRDVWEKRARKVVQERRTLRVERDALRKDAARTVDDAMVERAYRVLYPETIRMFVDGPAHKQVRAALTAAMAVQP